MSAESTPVILPEVMLRNALGYAHRGLRVLPIRPGGKAPIIGKWQHRATTDPDQIRAWWSRAPHANIGIAAGPASGFFVIDLDVDDASEYDGRETWRNLCAKNSHPLTVWQETPSGGVHLLFKWPSEERLAGRLLRNSSKVKTEAGPKWLIGEGIDTRGDGGQIVVFPSVRADGAYAWRSEKGLAIAEAPDWLLDLACKPDPTLSAPTSPPGSLSDRARAKAPRRRRSSATGNERRLRASARAALRYEVRDLASVGAGGRNNQLNRAAYSLGQWVGDGMLERSVVFDALYGAAHSNGLLGEDGAADVIATIESGLKQGIANPRSTRIGASSAPQGRAASAAGAARHAAQSQR